MTYEVKWTQWALDELTELWLAADSANRRRVTDVAHQIDLLLRRDPEAKGESRSEGQRVLLLPPFGAQLELDTDRHIVYVLHIWMFAKRTRPDG